MSVLPTTVGGRARWFTGYVLAQLGFLALLRVMAPRFFWLDDEQAQFVPTFHWFGRHLSGIRPPLMDPGLGAAGNFVADPQYGVFDPAHWLISWGVSRFDHLNLAALALCSLAVMILGLGVWAVLSLYRCPPALAAAASLGVASTGFFLWFGASWWPLMWSTAWLPWLWYGMATRGRVGVVVTGLSAYLIIVAGYPYNYFFAGAIVVAQLAERILSEGTLALRARDTTMRLLAGAGGLLAGAPTVLSGLETLPFANRSFETTELGNTGTFILNLADVLIGGSTLTPSISKYWDGQGTLVLAPIAASAVFAVPAVALISWRDAWRRPGVLTGGLLAALGVMATQAPTFLGPLRLPFRYMTVVGLCLPVVVALGLTYAPRMTKPRIACACGVLALQLVLAVSRSPALYRWHLVALVVGLVAVAAVVGLTRGTAAPPRVRRAVVAMAPLALVLSSFGGAVAGEQSAEAAQARIEAASGLPPSGAPARNVWMRPEWGSTIEEFRRQSLLTDTEVSVLAWKDDLNPFRASWGQGVLLGNANLLVDLKTGVGYTAAAQKEWLDHGCIDFFGQYQTYPGCVDRLLQGVPAAGGEAWIDLASSDEVLLSPATPAELRAHFEGSWVPAGPIGTFGYQRYLRPPVERMPGRVTATTGDATALSASPGSGGPAYGGKPFDSYVVSTGPSGGALVLRVPYWPGLRATLGGKNLAVEAIEGTFTAVTLPAGVDRDLVRIEFRPIGERLLYPCMAVAGLLIALAAIAGGRRAGPGIQPRTVDRGNASVRRG